MKRTMTFLAAVLLLVMLSGCTTARGSLIQDIRETESRSAEAEEEKSSGKNFTPVSHEKDTGRLLLREGENSGETVLEIRTEPDGADVYLNYRSVGESPAVIRGIEGGAYYLMVRKPGYYPESRWLRVQEGRNTIVSLELELITGYLSLSTDPEDAEVRANGKRIEQGVSELPVGRYEIVVRKFGYDMEVLSATIRERKTTRLQVDLEPADFTVSDLKLSRTWFNPDNPGILGELTARFQVSSYGSGQAEIFSPANERVYSREFDSFTQWDQMFRWNGESESEGRLPEGEYLLRISGTGRDGAAFSLQETTFTIDRDAAVRYRSLWSGLSGLMFAPAPDVLPRGSFQISALSLGYRDSRDNYFMVPSQLSARIAPADRLELDLQGSLVFTPSGSRGLAGTLGIEYLLSGEGEKDGVSAALTAKGTFSSLTGLDVFTNPPGFSLGLPLGLTLGPLHLIVTPELTVSPFPHPYDKGEAGDLNIWGYSRGGMYLDYGTLMTGFSTAVRTEIFGEDAGFHLPLQAGLEFHWMVPRTLLFLSFGLAGEFRGTDDYYLMAGGGLGVLY